MRTLTEQEFERYQTKHHRWDGKDFAVRVCDGCNSIRGIQGRPLRHEDVNRQYMGGNISVNYDRAWSITISIQIHLDDETVTYRKKNYVLRKVRVTLNFSGSERTIAGSVAAISLYQEAVAIAAEIEQAFNRIYFLTEDQA